MIVGKEGNLPMMEVNMPSKDNTPIDEFAKLVKLKLVILDLKDFVEECNSDSLSKLGVLATDIADANEIITILAAKSFKQFKFALLVVPKPKLAFTEQRVNLPL